MKIRMPSVGRVVAALLLAGLTIQAAELTRYYSKPGNLKMRIEGTSTIHDWQVQGTLIGGYIEVGPDFPVEPGQAATPGKMEARGEAKISIRSLFSVEKDGRKYSDRMDEVMYEHMRAKDHPWIVYTIKELVLKEPAKTKDAPYVFDAKGSLAVAGVTNTISMPVNITPLGETKLRITGTTSMKMTDFKVDPPNPLGLGIKTGDDIKVSFDWMVWQKPAAAK
ncbi:MAG TPA: YceI family protein [Candidatus Limnocylindrales bacterium]|nr:YceI family protein [Candidatus Limnocylindrales bacterium]